MPKSRKRKGHAKRIARRNNTKQQKQNKIIKAIKAIQDAQLPTEEQLIKRKVAETVSEEANSEKLTGIHDATSIKFAAGAEGAANLSDMLSEAANEKI